MSSREAVAHRGAIGSSPMGDGSSEPARDATRTAQPDPPDQEIARVTADGAYDTRKCHDAIAERGAHAVIPPRKNAKPWKAITAGAPRHCPRTNGGHCLDAQRGPSGVEISGPCALATMVRGLPATGPRAAPNAITAGAASKPRCTV